MPDIKGHIELERRIDAITVGYRHRQDLGDLESLMTSIREVGLLQPVTITPDGVLVCGRRRLEAMRRLGEHTLKVWVRSGISDELSHLLAQQDENELRKPYTKVEQSRMYAEIRRVTDEEAAARQEATRFGGDGLHGGGNGAEESSAPRGSGYSRNQAARMITGKLSFAMLEQVAWIDAVSNDLDRPPTVREFAANMLEEINNGAPVDPSFRRVRAAVELASRPASDEDGRGEPPKSVEQLSAEARARAEQEERRKRGRGRGRALKNPTPGTLAYRSTRSFVLTWSDMEGWVSFYDVTELAAELSGSEVDRFDRVIVETLEFQARLHAARATFAVG